MNKYIDIGANLLDGMYQGDYHGKNYHEPDLDDVLERSWDAGVEKIMVTAGNLDEARRAVTLCRQHQDRLYTTVGVHPTRARDWANYPDGPERYIEELADVIQDGVQDGTVVAIGECGLDYDRLEFCDAETQKACFKAHFALAQQFHLPMFLHSRAAGEDFQNFMLTYHSMMPRGGVVHSFDGSLEEMKAILKFDNICIGINGCSLKTEENLAVVAQIPLPVLMLETDAPWCGIRPSHASSHHIKTDILAKDKKKYAKGCQVKGRNEPANIVQIAEVIAGIQGTIVEQVTEHAFVNTIKMFFPSIRP